MIFENISSFIFSHIFIPALKNAYMQLSNGELCPLLFRDLTGKSLKWAVYKWSPLSRLFSFCVALYPGIIETACAHFFDSLDLVMIFLGLSHLTQQFSKVRFQEPFMLLKMTDDNLKRVFMYVIISSYICHIIN